VYDVAINSTFLSKVEGNLLLQTVLVTAAMEGMEDKYNLELDKNGS
jgi:PIH1 N-terminal domain